MAKRKAPKAAWKPISSITNDVRYVLLCGKNSDGTWWQDVGIHRGNRDFVDKYGVGHYGVTHWIALPETPSESAAS